MTGSEVAFHFNAKKTARGKWMARCTAHDDRKPSLGISEGKKGVILRCWSHGCDVRDIVKSAGLTMEQLFYDSGRKVDAKAYAEAKRKRDAEEEHLHQLRIGKWTLWAIHNGYTREDALELISLLVETAYVCANRPDPKWDERFMRHWEKYEGCEYARQHGMLPGIAKERYNFPMFPAHPPQPPARTPFTQPASKPATQTMQPGGEHTK